MSTTTGYPPKTAIELQDMDAQSRLRRKPSNAASGASNEAFGATASDLIQAKLPFVSKNEAESLEDMDDDAFDVISYWAMGASAWSVT